MVVLVVGVVGVGLFVFVFVVDDKDDDKIYDEDLVLKVVIEFFGDIIEGLVKVIVKVF